MRTVVLKTAARWAAVITTGSDVLALPDVRSGAMFVYRKGISRVSGMGQGQFGTSVQRPSSPNRPPFVVITAALLARSR